MKLLIVDDEKLIRKGIRYLLENSALSFDEIYEAENGRLAIQIVRCHHPEIVLMDIRMPGIDGLTAAKEITSLNKRTNIVFLTAHESFEYAREALRCKARDFLVKPVSKDTLVKTLETLALEIDQNICSRKEENQFRGELFSSIEELLISGLVKGTGITKEQLCSKLSLLSPASGDPWFTPECLPNVCMVIQLDGPLCDKKMKNLRSIRSGGVCYPFMMAKDKNRIICLTRVSEPDLDSIGMCTELAKNLAVELFEPSEFGLRIGIGYIRGDFIDLHQSFVEACRAIEQSTAPTGAGTRVKVIHISHIDKNRAESRPYQSVQRAIQYIEDNYSKKISLEGLARHLYLNPVYLSTIIKQHTGLTFSETVTFIRMDRAKKMLVSSFPVKEVASAVGYSDSNYFCRVFKKVTGVTASSFKNKKTR